MGGDQDNYISDNKGYWSQSYSAPNVDRPVFRFFGAILAPDFNIIGRQNEHLLDFGCGQGAAVNYFNSLGFNSFGVDFSPSDIQVAKHRYPHIAHRFLEIDGIPKADDCFFNGEFDVIIANQSLYYFSDTHLELRIRSLYDSLKEGGVFYATMMGIQSEKFFMNSTEKKDGLSKIKIVNNREKIENYWINFTHDEDHLINKFSLFKPRHVGYYIDNIRPDEGPVHHYTFVGVK